MSTISQGMLDPIPVGTYVRVSDGTPKPNPANRAVYDRWVHRNFDAILTCYRPDRPGIVTVQKVVSIGGWANRCFVDLEASRLVPVPGMPRFVLNINAFNPEVVGVIEDSPTIEVMEADIEPASREVA